MQMPSVCYFSPAGDPGGAPDPNDPIYNEGDPGGAPDPNDPIYIDGDSHELAGIWYLGGDYSNPFFIIDGNGDWEFYTHTVGDPEGELLDYGYTESDGDSRYVLFSNTEDTNYEMFWFDTDILTFNDENGTPIQMERLP